MIPIVELRKGNHVYWQPKFVLTQPNDQLPFEITEITQDKIGFIPVQLEQRVEFFDDGINPPETRYESPEEITPVRITEQWLATFAEGLQYPGWIKYVHELQNWFFWHTGKTELSI